MDLKRTGELLLDQAKRVLKQDGYHAPVVLVYGQHERTVVLLEFADVDSKYLAMYSIGRLHSWMKPLAVAFVSEAWWSGSLPDAGQRVADMPDKQEVLSVAVQTRTLRTWSVVMPFVKLGEEIVFGESMSGVDAESSLLEEFWRGVIDGEENQSWN